MLYFLFHSDNTVADISQTEKPGYIQADKKMTSMLGLRYRLNPEGPEVVDIYGGMTDEEVLKKLLEVNQEKTKVVE